MKAKKSIQQFILYLIVGGLAAIVEWTGFYVLSEFLGYHYMISTAAAFIVSTFTNWVFGRLILFHAVRRSWKEILQIYATSIIGLLLNLVIMWVTTETFGLEKMTAKVLATGLVFFWNFSIRKYVIYKI